MDSFTNFISRFQFGFTASFHIIFPSLSIGIAWFLVLIHLLYLKTSKIEYFRIYKFWATIFSLNFSLGVVTGIFMAFQFGLNWSPFSYAAGPIVGSIIGMEVMTAFFLEAGFLGIMLLGWNRVNKKVHFFATLMVAIGTLVSAMWIVGANSWLQTPAGYSKKNGQYFITDWWTAVFNPSFHIRFPHMVLAAMFAAAFLIAGISAWYLLRNIYVNFARITFSITMGVITILIPIQMWVGGTLYQKMSFYQPAKTQALEGFWDNTPSAPYLLFITPDAKKQRNNTQIGIPYLGSLLITHTLHGKVKGLKNTQPKEQPPMGMTFYFFRIMFLTGILMFFVAMTSIALRFTGRLYNQKWFLKLCFIMTPSGIIATVAGWITSETGRQPYIIYGLLRTSNASSKLTNGQVIFSFGSFLLIYLTLLLTFIILVRKTVKKGPEEIHETLKTGEKTKMFSFPAFRKLSN